MKITKHRSIRSDRAFKNKIDNPLNYRIVYPDLLLAYNIVFFLRNIDLISMSINALQYPCSMFTQEHVLFMLSKVPDNTGNKELSQCLPINTVV